MSDVFDDYKLPARWEGQEHELAAAIVRLVLIQSGLWLFGGPMVEGSVQQLYDQMLSAGTFVRRGIFSKNSFTGLNLALVADTIGTWRDPNGIQYSKTALLNVCRNLLALRASIEICLHPWLDREAAIDSAKLDFEQAVDWLLTKK